MNHKTLFRAFGPLLFLFLLLMSLPASAQEINADFDISKISYAPISKVDLGVSELTLEAGESYRFDVTFVPEFPAVPALGWFVADETVVSVDSATFTVTALSAGETTILAESLSGSAHAVCTVTVTGPQKKDAAKVRSGAEMISLSEEDLGKITSRTFKRHLDLVLNSNYTPQAFSAAMQHVYSVTARVTPGTEEAESKRALALGMKSAHPLMNLHAVTLLGTMEQILAFTGKNADLIRISGGEQIVLSEPTPGEFSTESVQKAMNLGANTEALSKISAAHKAGLDGTGTTVAVIDTGMISSHEQFTGRVVYEHCFSSEPFSDSGYDINPVCKGGKTEASGTGAAAASGAVTRSNFNHGSHVAGIAAGRDGIAPKAKIVGVQAFSELIYQCTWIDDIYEQYGYKRHCDDYTEANNRCCTSSMLSEQEYEAYDYLIDTQKALVKEGLPKISAVNMSYGWTMSDDEGNTVGWASACDSDDPDTKDFFDDLIEAEIVPAAAAGNEYLDEQIGAPACLSNAYAVGALADESTPKIVSFSNHSKNVAITAPGTNIWSSVYVYENGATCSDSAGTKNCYEYMSGTSMATPMVTGGMAIIHQAFPLRSVDEYKSILKNISSKTVNFRYGDNYETEDKTYSYKTKVMNFANITKYLHIANRWVIGFSDGILIKVPLSDINSSNPKFTVSAIDVKTNKTVLSNVTIAATKDPTGKYLKISLQSSKLQPGNIYKLQITQTSPYKTNTVTKYATPLRSVIGVTASPKNKAVTINGTPVSYSDGTRLFIREASGGKRVDTKYINGTGSALWTKSGLTNGKLYEVVANSYILYNKTYLWGSTISKVYFMPLSTPSGAKVTWSNSTTAKISMTKDSSVNGLRVLYRETGGAIKNGCESTGNSCSIKSLKKSGAYEFYVMKYKNSPSGKRHYGPGIVLLNNSSASGLAAPASPIIQSGSNKFTVTIKKDSAAKGISVLYRQNDGNFQLLCEAASDTCGKKLNVDIKTRYYTFYVMQYKVVNGKKVYSPGTIAKNLVSPKSAEIGEPVYSVVDEEIDMNEIYDALPDYLTEEEAYNEEVLALLIAEGSMEGFISKDIDAEDPDAEFDAEIELAGDFDLVEGENAIEDPVWEDEEDDGSEEPATGEGSDEVSDEGSDEVSDEGSDEGSTDAGSTDPNTIEFYRLDDDDDDGYQHDSAVPSFG